MRPARFPARKFDDQPKFAATLFCAVMVLNACSPKIPAPPTALRDLPQVVASVGYGELPPEMTPFAAAVARSYLPYIEIVAGAEGDMAPWSSKLGGEPYLPKGQALPLGPDGIPLALLAQLNFAEMPSLAGYPSRGILQFFIAGSNSKAHVYGMPGYDAQPYSEQDYFASMTKQGWFRIVYHPRVVQDRGLLESAAVAPKEMVLPFTGTSALQFRADREPVSLEDYRFERFLGKGASQFFEQFGKNHEQAATNYLAFSSKNILAKVGGYSAPVQQDPRAIRPSEDWIVLLELHTAARPQGFEMMWGDNGIGAFYIRSDDLKRLDFSKVMYYWDNH